MNRRAKAVIARTVGKPITVEEIEVAPPRHGEVTVRLAACGVCHSDLSATNGTIGYPLPLVLGHEGAGIISDVGEGVRRLKPGDHVITSFVSMCGHCAYCQGGKPQLCVQSLQALYTLPDGTVRTYDRHGEPLNVFCGCGVMAEYATLHSDNVIKIAEDVPLDRAALIACGVLTGIGAVTNTAHLTAGSVAVVFGCGGVGLNTVQGCALVGARMIVAVDIRADNRALALRFGATHAVDAAQAELGKALYKLTGGGADYAFDCVGLGKVTEQAWNVLKRGGTAVTVGIASGDDKVVLSTQRLTLSERTLTGSYYGSARPQHDVPQLVGLYRAGRLKLDELITRRYSIEEAPRALADLEQGGAGRGVIVF
jgi:Zn-dependent alcohol dehydrogenase